MLLKRTTKIAVLLLAMASPAFADPVTSPSEVADESVGSLSSLSLTLPPIASDIPPPPPAPTSDPTPKAQPRELSSGFEMHAGPGFRSTVKGPQIELGGTMETNLNLRPYSLLSNEGVDFSANAQFSDNGVSKLQLDARGISDWRRNKRGSAIGQETNHTTTSYEGPLGAIGIDRVVDHSNLTYDAGFKRLTVSRGIGLEGQAHWGRVDGRNPQNKHDERDFENAVRIPFTAGVKGITGVSNGHGLLGATAGLGLDSPETHFFCIGKIGDDFADNLARGHSLCGKLGADVEAGLALTTNGFGPMLSGRQFVGGEYKHSKVTDDSFGKNIAVISVGAEVYAAERGDPTQNKNEMGAFLNLTYKSGRVGKRHSGHPEFPGVEYDASTGAPVEQPR